MLKFRIKRIIPPGGLYFFEVEQTKTMFRSPTMSSLLAQVERHLQENKLEVPENLPALVEDFICRNVPEGFCYGDPEGRPITKAVTLANIQNNTQDMVNAGGGVVAPGVARQRLETCLQCPANNRKMCSSCIGLISWARKLVGTSCPRDSYAGVCTVDATAIAAKVHVKNIAPNADYPPECWVMKENKNEL